MKLEPIPYRPSYLLNYLKDSSERRMKDYKYPEEYSDRWEKLLQFRGKFNIREISTVYDDNKTFNYFRVSSDTELDIMIKAAIKRQMHPLPIRFDTHVRRRS